MLSINCKDIAEPNVHYDLLLAPALCISQNKCVLACDNLIFCYLAPSTHKAKSLSSSNIPAPQYIYNHAKKKIFNSRSCFKHRQQDIIIIITIINIIIIIIILRNLYTVKLLTSTRMNLHTL